VKLPGRPLSIDVLPEMIGDEVFGINEQYSKLHHPSFMDGALLALLFDVISNSFNKEFNVAIMATEIGIMFDKIGTKRYS
jgi:hypothetical protein